MAQMIFCITLTGKSFKRAQHDQSFLMLGINLA